MIKSYLLDTNICIYLLKKKYNLAQKLSSLKGATFYISEITLAELYYGASKSGNYEEKRKEVLIIEQLFRVLPVRDCLQLFGENKAYLELKGERIDDFDVLIGSSAVYNSLILVTENVKHLGRIPNIVIENWIKR